VFHLLPAEHTLAKNDCISFNRIVDTAQLAYASICITGAGKSKTFAGGLFPPAKHNLPVGLSHSYPNRKRIKM
jgi:hypothetical protein